MWKVKIKRDEMGLLYKDGEFAGVLESGSHWLINPFEKTQVEKLKVSPPWIERRDLEDIVKSGLLGKRALSIDLKDGERALVRVDGRLARIIGPGLHALWTKSHEIEVERVDASQGAFPHAKPEFIMMIPGAMELLNMHFVPEGHLGALFKDGQAAGMLNPGIHMFWKEAAQIKVQTVDMRERSMDIAGQDIMSADKVTLRMNAVLAWKVADASKFVLASASGEQSLYREAQLALRAAVGAKELDALLSDKSSLAKEVEESIKARAAALGIEAVSFGIRDLILPGEMKEILNRVIEAKKAAEANLITRREETAALRSQANTAKLYEESPSLLRLRELEALERIAKGAKLSVIVGEKGLKQQLASLI